MRTPKSGDEGPARPRSLGRYRMPPDGWSRIEAGFGIVLALEVAVAAAAGYWATVPFLALFAFGFLSVGFGSLREGRAHSGAMPTLT